MDADKMIQEHGLASVAISGKAPTNKDVHKFMLGDGWTQVALPLNSFYFEKDRFNFDEAVAYMHDKAKVLVIVSEQAIAISCTQTGTVKTFYINELKIIMELMRGDE